MVAGMAIGTLRKNSGGKKLADMLSSVHEILRTEDVEGFIALGAPDDEYASEAREIAAAIDNLSPNERTVEGVAAIIALVWAKSFDLAADELEKRIPAIRQVAQQLMGEIA